LTAFFQTITTCAGSFFGLKKKKNSAPVPFYQSKNLCKPTTKFKENTINAENPRLFFNILLPQICLQQKSPVMPSLRSTTSTLVPDWTRLRTRNQLE
jgi:hypothetical protein